MINVYTVYELDNWRPNSDDFTIKNVDSVQSNLKETQIKKLIYIKLFFDGSDVFRFSGGEFERNLIFTESHSWWKN